MEPHLRYYIKKSKAEKPVYSSRDRFIEECELAGAQFTEPMFEHYKQRYNLEYTMWSQGSVITSIDFVALETFDDYLVQREAIEGIDGFEGWINTGDIQWVGDETFIEMK